jgi:hypothetical protein
MNKNIFLLFSTLNGSPFRDLCIAMGAGTFIESKYNTDTAQF